MNKYNLQKSWRLLPAALLTLLLASAVAASSEWLLERLRSDYAAMVSAETDFHNRRARGTLSGNEAADYAAYVAGLHRRVAQDCQALRDNSVAIPAGLSCPDDPVDLLVPAAIDQTSEQTAAEATATLESELFEGLGEFDEMLLREQERIRASAPQASANAASGGGGSGSEGGTTSDSGGTDAISGVETTYGEGAGPGSPRTTVSSSAPPGTPDGHDDDVVARQLREAAEKEADPELKKKLWEEYRKYKAGTS
jgi:hypothetical protein